MDPLMRLVRVAESAAASFAVLVYGRAPACVALERPWKADAENVSCIPAGAYWCQRGLHRLEHMDHDFETFEVLNVPRRSKVLFHKGNVPADSHGCILLGSSFGNDSVLESKNAFEHFMWLLRGQDRFQLRIELGFPLAAVAT